MSLQWKWGDASERLIEAFVRPPGSSPVRAWAIIIGTMAVIGTADHVSGIEVSLYIFYLIPISVATAWLGPWAGAAVATASTLTRVISDTVNIYPAPLPWHTRWNVTGGLAVSYVIVWLLHSLIILHRRLEGKVEERTEQLRLSVADRQRLALEILDVGERERSAFGRELHDELGQHLVATALAAQVLAQTLGNQKGGNEAKTIVRWIEEGIGKTRNLARGLLLAQIEPERLPQELEELAAGSSQGPVECRSLFQGREIHASPGECAQLFRIAQEAVGNALHHAQPHSVDIKLASDDQALCLIVEDDGCGLPLPRVNGIGMGLRIMEHRAQIIGGSLSIISTPGEGTKVICRLPRREPASA